MNVVWHTCSGVWHTCSGVWQSCSLTLVVWATRSIVWHTYGHRVAPYERSMDNVFNRMKNAYNRMRGVWTSYDTRVVPCLLNNYPWRVFYEHDWTRFYQNSTVVFSRVHNRVCVKVALCCWKLILPMQNDTSWKWLKPWLMGTHLKVLSESYPMNTNMTGFR